MSFLKICRNIIRQNIHSTSDWIDNQHADQSTQKDIPPIPTADGRLERYGDVIIPIFLEGDCVTLLLEITAAILQGKSTWRDSLTNQLAVYLPNLEFSLRRHAVELNLCIAVIKDTCAARGQCHGKNESRQSGISKIIHRISLFLVKRQPRRQPERHFSIILPAPKPSAWLGSGVAARASLIAHALESVNTCKHNWPPIQAGRFSSYAAIAPP